MQDSPFGPIELYNLKADPREANNLANQKNENFAALTAALRKHIQNGGKVPWQDGK